MANYTGVGGTYRRLIEIRAALERADQNDHLGVRTIKAIVFLSISGDAAQAPVTW